MSLVQKLVDSGLSEKESRAYLALLELEVATAHEVADKAEINRSSAYVVLESLREKGLASVSAGEPTKKYVASSPDLLVEKAADAAEKQAKIERNITDLLPDLKSLYKETRQRPRVRIFEGRQGLIESFEDTLRVEHSVIKIYSSARRIFEYFPEYIAEYVQKRVQKDIRMIGIHPDEPAFREAVKRMPTSDIMTIIPPEKFVFSSEIAIYENKVGYVSFAEEVAIVIENEHIYKAMSGAFDLAFEEAKRLQKSSK